MPSFTLTLLKLPMDPKSTDPANPNSSQQDLSSLSPTPQIPVDAPVIPSQPEPLPAAPPVTPLPDLNSAAPTSSPPISFDQNSSQLSDPGLSFQAPASIEPAPIPTFTPPPPENTPNTPTDFGISTGGFNWSENSGSSPQSSADEALKIPTPIMAEQNEPAPSDLSHLVNTSEPPSSIDTGSVSAPTPQPETLMPNSTSAETDIPNVPSEESHKSFPKWIIGVGVGLLLAVAGASAYFILGIGRTSLSGSVPATGTQETTTAPPVIKPTAVPTIAIPIASPAAGLSLPGGSGTQATSAADLLKQKQGQ